MNTGELKKTKMNLATVCFIIFSFTATTCYGIEDLISWGGPGLTFLTLLIVPLVWALPMSLVSAELTSMYPKDGGLYAWVGKAFGSQAGFLAGWWYFICCVFSTSVFLVIAVSYIDTMMGGLGFMGRILISTAIVLIIAAINIKGLGAVGVSTIIFVLIALTPFAASIFLAAGKIQFNPFESFALPSGENTGTFASYGLIIGMWMYCGYEAIGSIAEELEGAYHLIPRGLFICLPLTAVIYIVPTMMGSAAIGHWPEWGAEAGPGIITYVEMGYRLGGNFLMWAFLVSAIFSSLTCYNSYIAAASRLPFVMSRDNLFFKSFAYISPKYGTPVVAIVITSLLNIFLSTQSFSVLVVMAMTLYFIPVVMFLLAAFVLRFKEPDNHRPYKIPGSRWFLFLLILPPIFAVGVAFWHMTEFEIIAGLIGLASGPVAYWILKWRYGGPQKEKSLEL